MNYHPSAKTTCTQCKADIDKEFYIMRGNYCYNCSGKSGNITYDTAKISAEHLKITSTGINKDLEKKYPNLNT